MNQELFGPKIIKKAQCMQIWKCYGHRKSWAPFKSKILFYMRSCLHAVWLHVVWSESGQIPAILKNRLVRKEWAWLLWWLWTPSIFIIAAI